MKITNRPIDSNEESNKDGYFQKVDYHASSHALMLAVVRANSVSIGDVTRPEPLK